MKTLVTGATGFIGARLCSALKRRGDAVRALALPWEEAGQIAGQVDEIWRGDITVRTSLEGIGENIDVVYHLAARVLDYGTREQFFAPILAGTHNLLEVCAGRAGRFLFVSSFAALGVGRHLRGLDEGAEARASGVPYNDAKLEAEVLVRAHDDKFDRGCTIVRPSNVIGPRSAWVVEVARQFRRSLVPLIDGGHHSASMLHVDNLVDGLILAGTADVAAGQTYHLRDDWQVTWRRYVTDIGAMLGKRPVGNIPFRVGWIAGAVAEALCLPLGLRPPVTRMAAALMGRDNDVDTTKARRELGWRTRVSYEEAIQQIQATMRETPR
jgi:nucleoside-diphosphate-sugar epimerase